MNISRPIHTTTAATLAALVILSTTAFAESGRGRDGDGDSTDGTTTEETTTGATTIGTTTGPAAGPPTAPLGPQFRPVVRQCGSRSRITLTVRPTPEVIAIDVQVVGRRRSAARKAERWRVVVLHERRVWQKSWAVSKPVTGWFQKRTTVANWVGRDAITARAVSPLGETCVASLIV